MTLFYRAIQSAMASKDGKKGWHPTLVKTGTIVGTQQLGELIAEKSSLTPGDVHNVIRNLMSVMREQLLNSHSVRLDGLGTFTVYARSRGTGVENEEDVNPNQITMLNYQFTPEYFRPAGIGTTRAITNGVKFVHVKKMLGTATSEGDNAGGSGGGGGGGVIDPNA